MKNMYGGTIRNCTVNDGTTITASGYASGDVAFSGNTWPAGYPQAGNSSSVNDGSDGNGKYYRLSADIDMTYANCRNISSTFTGHFDGQGHTIKISSDYGLFDTISADNDSIAVRNLNIAGTVINRGVSAGGLARSLYSGIIENCSFTGLVSANTYNSAGFVGWMNDGTATDTKPTTKISHGRKQNHAANLSADILPQSQAALNSLKPKISSGSQQHHSAVTGSAQVQIFLASGNGQQARNLNANTRIFR